MLFPFGIPTSRVTAATLYYPYGPQTSISKTAVTSGGWTLCYSGTYSSTASLSSIESVCNGSYVMLAAGVTGSSTLTVAAAATRARVFQATTSTTTAYAENGSFWYYIRNSSGSIGFAPTSSINLYDADISNLSDPLRLSWHTNTLATLTLSVGWRAGSNTYLNSDSSFTRYIYTSNDLPSTTIPATTTTVSPTTTTVPGVSTNVSNSSLTEVVEGTNMTVYAPVGRTFSSVLFASYGTPTNTSGILRQSTCHASSTGTIIAGLAIGKTSFSLAVNNSVFGDPCPNTPKWIKLLLATEAIPITTTSAVPSSSVVVAATVGAPMSVTATAGDSRVVLSWTAGSVAANARVLGYAIQYSKDKGLTWINLTSNTLSTSTYNTVNSLTNGLTYTFRIATVSSAGTSSYSASVSTTPVGVAQSNTPASTPLVSVAPKKVVRPTKSYVSRQLNTSSAQLSIRTALQKVGISTAAASKITASIVGSSGTKCRISGQQIQRQDQQSTCIVSIVVKKSALKYVVIKLRIDGKARTGG